MVQKESGTWFGGLPPAILEQASNRLGVTSLIFAVGFFLVWTGSPAELQPEGTFPMIDVAIAIAVGLSFIVFALSRAYRRDPLLLHDYALAYEVILCFLIAIAEQWHPWPKGQIVRGVSWVCIVLMAFPFTVPSTPAKTAFAALAGAAMGPLALAISVGKGNEAPPPATIVGMFAPNFIAAGAAYVLSRVIHQLGLHVREARQLGAYEVEELLGRGGMGEVWRARHRLLARPAAVKLVRPDAFGAVGPDSTKTVLRRFEREARATASLESPHTISLYDFGIAADGTFYYVMELLDGMDLETMVMRHGPLPAERVIHVLVQVCHSLAEAHHRGMVHRDIKPANIYVCRMGLDYDFVKVLDFGLVTSNPNAAHQLTQLTGEGLTTGTPAYMAPEMANAGAPLGARSDIYALGCVAYWMLTGQLVFDATSPMKVLADHVQTPPVPPSKRTELEVPRDLEEIVLACLAKKPEGRPQGARELAARLEHCAVAHDWTSERAEKWWRTNVPKSETTRSKDPKATKPILSPGEDRTEHADRRS